MRQPAGRPSTSASQHHSSGSTSPATDSLILTEVVARGVTQPNCAS
ncbi:hypothetical protein [Nonomuraea salmonea]